MVVERRILLTGDGSHTVSIPGAGVTYHSMHGAAQESRHIFIEAGLKPLITQSRPLNVFEMGFGTGLNALLTLELAAGNNLAIHYVAAEPNPLAAEEYSMLNYCVVLQLQHLTPMFTAMHAAGYEKDVLIHPEFTLHKTMKVETKTNWTNRFDLVYYDAFAPGDQPEMWTENAFATMFDLLNNDGILVTYSSKGAVRRALAAVGFEVEKLPGPMGKREITRAKKKYNI